MLADGAPPVCPPGPSSYPPGPYLLAVLTAAHAWWPARLIIHAVLPAANLHTDDKAECADHDAADRHTSNRPGA